MSALLQPQAPQEAPHSVAAMCARFRDGKAALLERFRESRATALAATHLTKALTRVESTEVIVFWQALTVMLFSLPLALPVWLPPTLLQWAGFALCGLLGSLGHYCLTRSYRHADISATQSVKFLDLVWASLLGLLVFADWPSASTLLGGALISVAALWLARRESRALSRMDNEP